MSRMTESDVRDGIAYVRAYLNGDTAALAVLARYGDNEAMLTAVTAIFAGNLLNVFGGDQAGVMAWLDGIVTESAPT